MLSKLKPKKLSTRLMLISFISGLIPILIFGVLIQVYGSKIHREVTATISQLGTEEWQRTEKVLWGLAEESIRRKTVSVSSQIEHYLKTHPARTLKDLQQSDEFRQIAVQPVGKTGFTSVGETASGIIRFHQDRSIENQDPRRLSEEFAVAWTVMETTSWGKPSNGYYTWERPDGKMDQKYLYAIPLERKTADGVQMNVIASAYINELVGPIEAVRDIRGNSDHHLRITVDRIVRSFMGVGMLIMGIGLLIVLAAACWAGTYFSKVIVRLKEATKEVNDGNFDVRVDSSVTGEAGELVQDFNAMVAKLSSTTVSKELLEESEYRFRTLAETTSSGILIYRDDLFVYANPAALRIVGSSYEEITKMHFWEIAHDDYRDLFREAGHIRPDGDKASRAIHEMRLVDKGPDGKWVDASIGVMELEGRPAGIVTIFDITERKKAQSELRESEERYRVAIENSNDAVSMITGDTHAYVNRQYLEVFGYDTMEEVMDQPVSMMVHPEDRERVGEINRLRQLGDPVPSRYVFRGIRKNGDIISLEVSAANIAYGGQSVSLAYLRDITERIRAEQALEAERRKFRLLIDRAPFGMVMVGEDNTFRYINPKFQELFGYGLDDIPDAAGWFRNAFPQAEYRHLAKLSWPKDEAAARTGERTPVALSVACKDGSSKMVNFKSIRLETGDFLVTCEDITEVVRAEDALRESEEEYRNIIESSLVGIFIMQDNAFRFVNHKFCEIHNITSEQAMSEGGPFHMIHPEDADVVNEFLQKKEEDFPKSHEFEFRIIVGDGDTRTLKVLESRSSYKRRPAVVGTVLDISKEKILERQLLQSQKLETVGRLAGGIAHDFNNMLNIILGNAQLAKTFVPEDHRVFDYCTSIERAVFRAAEFVKQLLAFSRRQLLELKVVDMNDTLRNFAKMVDRVIGENIDMRVITARTLPPVKVDVGQIDQILLNLVINARDSMAQGGEILMETHERALSEEYCRFNPDAKPGNYVVLSITDTGMGMDQETLDKIFEPFFSGKGMGTGLGLSVVYGIVQQHSGFINVYSEIGKGTTFKIYLPSASEDVVREAPSSHQARKVGGETVLVVEDEDPLRNIAAEVLETIGYRVITAADGEEAIDIFKERCGEIDLALIDVVMPKLGGKETYEAMKQIKPSIRALFMTGYSLNGIHTNFILQQGIDAIQKPYSFEDLARKIRDILDR